MTKEQDPTLRAKSMKYVDVATGKIGEYAIANALVSIAYSLVRYLDMDARYDANVKDNEEE